MWDTYVKEYGFQMIMICYPYLLHFLFLNNMREVYQCNASYNNNNQFLINFIYFIVVEDPKLSLFSGQRKISTFDSISCMPRG